LADNDHRFVSVQQAFQPRNLEKADRLAIAIFLCVARCAIRD